MKVLWLCNVVPSTLGEQFGQPVTPYGGWLSGLLGELRNINDISLGICFPIRTCKSIVHKQIGRIECFGFPDSNNYSEYSICDETYFRDILNAFTPDIVHIFGTEKPHTAAMTKAFSNPDHTVINIQGLSGIIALHYSAGLPSRVIYGMTLRDIVRGCSIFKQIERYKRESRLEIQALKSVSNVIGRTDWDQCCVEQINPDLRYYFCNEILRESFYHGQWEYGSCKMHTLLISQANSPIKGIHFLLQAMPHILERFPDAKILAVGKNIFDTPSYRLTYYQKYIKKLIRDLNLKNAIEFTGVLSEAQMRTKLLGVNLFISASVIENESNTLSEAKILGVPVVASFAGGVTNRIVHKEDGYLYQHDAPYILAYYVNLIFSDVQNTKRMAERGREKAMMLFDRKKNCDQMISIYCSIHQKGIV